MRTTTTDQCFPAVDFTRFVLARAVKPKDFDAQAAYAAERWGRGSTAVRICRSAVPGVDAADLIDDGIAASAHDAFLDTVVPMTILGKLQGLRVVRPNASYHPHADVTVGHWTGENKPLKVSRLAFERETLPSRKVGAILVTTKEALKDTTPQAESLFRRDLVRAVAAASDLAFIDPANTGSAVMPASVTNGALSIASTGTAEDDLAAAIELFEGDFATAAWVMHPRLAVSIAMALRGSSLADLGARGGTLLGLPAIVSQSCPLTSSGSALALLDASGIAAFDEGVAVQTAEEGAMELDDAPTGETDTPAGMTANVISLFQADCVAIKVTRRTNWANGRPGGVVVVNDCHYGAVS